MQVSCIFLLVFFSFSGRALPLKASLAILASSSSILGPISSSLKHCPRKLTISSSSDSSSSCRINRSTGSSSWSVLLLTSKSFRGLLLCGSPSSRVDVAFSFDRSRSVEFYFCAFISSNSFRSAVNDLFITLTLTNSCKQSSSVFKPISFRWLKLGSPPKCPFRLIFFP